MNDRDSKPGGGIDLTSDIHQPARLRPATEADAAAVAELYLASRNAALPTVRWAHDCDAVKVWIRSTLMPTSTVIVAERTDGIAAFIAWRNNVVEHLYVHPDYWRTQLGSELLKAAKSESPDGLKLHCFQRNMPARAFYERHGFVAIKLNDGADNEEHEPDILYAWPSLNETAQ